MNKKELKNSLITRGIILLLFFVGSILYACTADNKTSTKKETTVGKANIKNKLYITDSHSVSVRTVEYKDGHELIITIFAAGTAGSVSSMHDPLLCAKCRSERGLPQIK